MDKDQAVIMVADIRHRLELISRDIRDLVDGEIMGDRYDEELNDHINMIDALAIDIGGMAPGSDA